jgi:hypothetical protein
MWTFLEMLGSAIFDVVITRVVRFFRNRDA